MVATYAGSVARRSGTRSHDSQDAPIRITEAAASRDEDLRQRQRRYLWSMGLRTVCVVGAVLTAPGWGMWLFLVGAVFLPYVAVVMANAAGKRDDGFRLVDAPGQTRSLPGGERGRPNG